MPTSQPQWGTRHDPSSRRELARVGAFVAGSTVALTASTLGAVGLLTGGVTGLGGRLPLYVLATALAFVAAVVTFEESSRRADRVIALSAATASAVFVFVTFGGEGVAYVLQNPGTVGSALLFYVLAVGLVGTGVGYWILNHWSELTWSGSRL